MSSRGLSLKGLLALAFGLLAAVLAACLALLIGQHTTQTEQQTIRNRLSTVAEVTTHALDIGMYERMHDVVQLANLEQFRDNRRPANNRQLLEGLQAGLPDYAWIGFANTRGRVQYATGGMLEGVDVSHHAWFAEGQERLFLGDVSTAPQLSGLLPGRARDGRFIDIAIPIRDHGNQAIGVLGARLSWDWARTAESTVLTLSRRQAGVEIFILNAAGQVILAPPGQSDIKLPALSLLDDASRSLRWPDGHDYLTGTRLSRGYRDYPGLGWRVVARQPTEQAFASIHLLQRYIAAVGVALALLFSLLGLWLAYFLSRPLTQLAAAADQIRQGHSSTHLPEGGLFRETRQLSASFDALFSELRAHQNELSHLNTSLEQQVLDRTEAVDVANRHLMSLLEERGNMMEKLEALAATDSLTGLLNRRAFYERADIESKRAQRQKSLVSVVTFDLDHFKQVNDRYGHEIGDEALRQSAAACRKQLRDIDIVARFGGEEFVILLPETDLTGAQQVAERLRKALADITIHTAQGTLQFTASFGVSLMLAGTDLTAALQAVDKALYVAKQGGRNRVEVHIQENSPNRSSP